MSIFIQSQQCLTSRIHVWEKLYNLCMRLRPGRLLYDLIKQYRQGHFPRAEALVLSDLALNNNGEEMKRSRRCDQGRNHHRHWNIWSIWAFQRFILKLQLVICSNVLGYSHHMNILARREYGYKVVTLHQQFSRAVNLSPTHWSVQNKDFWLLFFCEWCKRNEWQFWSSMYSRWDV